MSLSVRIALTSLDICSQLMFPLVIRAIITFGQEHYAAKNAGTAPPNIGRGIGLAIAAFVLNEVASLGMHQVCSAPPHSNAFKHELTHYVV